MPRAALARRARPQAMPVPFDGGERAPFQDPRGPGPKSTLPYREAVELLRCIQIMGPSSNDYCRSEVLGEPMAPIPEFKQLTGTSSPVPFSATVAADGSAAARIGAIDVTIQPDQTTTDPKMANRAETTFLPSFSTPGATTKNGLVDTVNPIPPVTLTMVTTYGSGASATDKSAYGRGTTAQDIATGNTSLGFHEGNHGIDFLRFMANRKQPIFAGAKGMTVAQFTAAQNAYKAAWNAFFAEMGHLSVHNTDCVGQTGLAPNEVKVVCGHTHKPLPPP
jgi:hypothetical protein